MSYTSKIEIRLINPAYDGLKEKYHLDNYYIADWKSFRYELYKRSKVIIPYLENPADVYIGYKRVNKHLCNSDILQVAFAQWMDENGRRGLHKFSMRELRRYVARIKAKQRKEHGNSNFGFWKQGKLHLSKK